MSRGRQSCPHTRRVALRVGHPVPPATRWFKFILCFLEADHGAPLMHLCLSCSHGHADSSHSPLSHCRKVMATYFFLEIALAVVTQSPQATSPLILRVHKHIITSVWGPFQFHASNLHPHVKRFGYPSALLICTQLVLQSCFVNLGQLMECLMCDTHSTHHPPPGPCTFARKAPAVSPPRTTKDAF